MKTKILKMEVLVWMPIQCWHCWHCKCGTQQNQNHNHRWTLFHFYPISYHIFHFNLILLLCTLQEPKFQPLLSSSASQWQPRLLLLVPCQTLSDSVTGESMPLCQLLFVSLSIFIWVISRFVKIATFLPCLGQCLCFYHAWFWGFN